MRRFAVLAALALPLALGACRKAEPGGAHLDSLSHEHATDRPDSASAAATTPPRVPVTGESFAYGNATGYLAAPTDTTGGPLPGLILVHEWWGLNDQIKQVAERYAGEGYRVLAVDLYGGKVATSPDSARAYVTAAMQNRMGVAANVRSAYQALAQAGAPKVGILGYCAGGAVTAQMAVAMPLQLAAAVVYYGDVGGITEAQMRPMQGAVLGFFGGQDSSIPLDSVRAFESRLKAAGKDATVVVYPEAGHAFANPTGDRYEAGPAEDSWEKSVAFLARRLKGAPTT